MSNVLVFGHLNPDNDAIMSAVVLSQLLNQVGYQGNTYEARRLGPLPAESEKLLAEVGVAEPELLESISAALGVSVNALKDYGVETAGDLMSLLVRLEGSFGIVPSADGTGLSLNPKAPHAPKAAMAIKLWAEKRAQLENGEIDADEYEDWKASL